jgi:serine/threonine protein kinase
MSSVIIDSGGYATIYYPPRKHKNVPIKFLNRKYIERYTKIETFDDILFGNKARSIFDPLNTMSSPILYVVPQQKGYSIILPFRKGTIDHLMGYDMKIIMKQLIPLMKGLVRLHKQKIVHHDIKIPNMLYNDRPHLQLFLIDWGTSCTFHEVFSDKYNRWLVADNTNLPPEYKILARFKGILESADLAKGYSKNYSGYKYLKYFQPRYDILFAEADKQLTKKLEKNPYYFDSMAGAVDVFAMGIVICALIKAFGTPQDEVKYQSLIRGMIHPNIQRRWSFRRCIKHLEQK